MVASGGYLTFVGYGTKGPVPGVYDRKDLIAMHAEGMFVRRGTEKYKRTNFFVLFCLLSVSEVSA